MDGQLGWIKAPPITKEERKMARVEKTTAEPKPVGTVEQEAVLTRSQPSVLIKIDSKGSKSYEVKAYADTMEEALVQAVKASNTLDSMMVGGVPSTQKAAPKSILQNLADKDDL
jgi:putative NADH-flavin reductase